MTTNQTPEAAGAPSRAASDPTIAMSVKVHGQPAPKGSKRHLGKGVMVESSKAAKPWHEAVKHAALDVLAKPWHAGGFPLDGPVSVELVFTVPKPKSAPKRRVTWPTRKPDLDKLVRNSLDPLREVGVYRDDAQVVEVTATKVYPREGVDALEVPGAVIDVWQLGVS